MIPHPTILSRLRDEFADLCEACFQEQASLEEGPWFDPLGQPPSSAARGHEVAACPAPLAVKSPP